MKQLIRILIFLSFIFLTTSAYCQWQTIQTPSTGFFHDVSIPSPNLIWAVGADDSFIVRSTDGGLNWVSFNRPSLQMYIIFAIDTNTAWISGGNPNGRIYKTTSGGINWVEQTYSPVSFINNIYFFNSNTGIFFTDPVAGVYGFFITRNGGNTWTRSPNSPTGNILLTNNRMGVLDTNLVWYVLYTTAGYRMLKLTGGLNNTWVSIPFMNNSPMTNVIFKDMNTALATNGLQVQISTNGGLNWTIKNDSAIGSNIVRSFIHIPSTDWVFVKSGWRVGMSFDFCESWQPPALITDAGGIMRGYDTNNIFIGGDIGKIFKYNHAYIGIETLSSEIPENYSLSQNYPNPFNPSTNIEFSLPKAGLVKLTVYDILGAEVFSISEQKQAGKYKVQFDGTSLASGLYFYTLKAGSFIETRKLVLVK